VIKLKSLLTEDLIIEQEYIEFKNYIIATNYLTESTELYEFTGKLKGKIDFIKNLASQIKTKFKDLLKLFMNSKVFKFFSLVGWSMDKLFTLVKKGFKLYKDLLKAISDYIASTKVGKWTEEKLKQLDKFLQKHPKTKKIAGIGVAALLVYIWFNMTFTGDVAYDFDMSDMLAALVGKFSLAKLFAGSDGVKLLLLFATGAIGLTFPWPGAATKQFVGAVVGSLGRAVKKRIKWK
tara:strand:- start:21 stop:725 length:705 start_codon:yes stop_codon:yes gene_type:complete